MRPRSLVAALRLTLAAMIGFAFAPPAAGADWPAFRGGGGQEMVRATSPGRDLDRRWTSTLTSVVRTPADPTAPFQECVVASAGHVYTVWSEPDPAGAPVFTTKQHLASVDAATGAVEWSTASWHSVGAEADCPAVDAQRVYVSRSEDVAAFDVGETLSPAWSSPRTFPGSLSAPGDGRVYGAPLSELGDGPAFALDAVTGDELWAEPVEAPVRRAPLLTPLAVVLLVANSQDPEQYLMSYQRDDGEAFPLVPPRGIRDVVALGDVAYWATSTGEITASETDTPGPPAGWTVQLPAARIGRSLAVDADRVYVTATTTCTRTCDSVPSVVMALDRTSGATVWGPRPVTTPGDGASAGQTVVPGSMMVLGGVLFDAGGEAFAAADGTPLGPHDLFPNTGPLGPASVPAYDEDSRTVFTWEDTGDGKASLVALRDMTGPQVTLDSPADGGRTASRRPELTFAVGDGAGSGVASAALLLDADDAGVALTPGQTSFNPPADLGEGTHEWRIRATDVAGNVTVSPARSLFVDTTDPAPPALVEPADGAGGQPLTPAFAWTLAADAGGVDRYELVVDGTVAATLPAAGCAADRCAASPGSPLAEGAHSWLVRAVDLVGHTASSAARSFTAGVAPTAVLVVNPNPALTASTVTLDASRSTDVGSGIARYEFDADGDGSYETDAGATPRTTRAFARAGTFGVGVRVTDQGGLQAEARGTVRIVDRGGTARPLGVSIEGGARWTNDPRVTLTVVGPPFATLAILSNDGGFARAVTVPLAATIPWTLESSGPERLPKTVYVRFRGGETTTPNYQDDIILDETAPTVTSAQVLAPGAASGSAATVSAAARRFVVRIRASDRTSGVGKVQITNNRRRPGTLRRFSRRVSFRGRAAPVWVRVLDRAGNRSPWRRARRSATAAVFALAFALPGAAGADLVADAPIGTPGSGAGQLAAPQGLAVAGGDLLVVDAGNARVQRLTTGGAFVAAFGSPGSGPGQFNSPSGIAVGPDGTIYVADTGNDRVQRFDSAGAFLSAWGTTGAGDGQFQGPAGVAVDGNGTVLVADRGNGRVERFTPEGAFIDAIGAGTLTAPQGIAADAAGGAVVADAATNRIVHLAADGTSLGAFGEGGTGFGQFDRPAGVTLDGDEVVYVTDGSGRLQKLSSGGVFLSGAGGLLAPFGVVVRDEQRISLGPVRTVYVAESGAGRIARFTDTGDAGPPAGPPPEPGRSGTGEPAAGVVRVRPPGTDRFRPVRDAQRIPVGSVIDVREGTIRLTTSRGTAGGEQSAVFFDGIFRLRQRRARVAVTQLDLVSDYSACPLPGGATAAAKKKRKKGKKAKINSLWGDGRGEYRVKGNSGATAVKGTRWLTQDRCDGTFVSVRSGSVTVRDFGRRRTVKLERGQTYLARRR